MKPIVFVGARHKLRIFIYLKSNRVNGLLITGALSAHNVALLAQLEPDSASSFSLRARRL